MIDDMNRTMREAMRLMQTGELRAATDALQRGLRGGTDVASPASTPGDAGAGSAILDGQFSVVPDASTDGAPISVTEEPAQQALREELEGGFHDHRFMCEAGALNYKLFVPGGSSAASRPLIVMLHGCTQSPDDFARGTRMNVLAQQRGCLVAYPEQAQGNNAGRCWHWFRRRDQQRGRGEPALIAALARHLVAEHRVDERRVFVAGLSAGGAMAAVLANTYPDVFAAIAVHSGLPFGAAHDLPSAVAAMKQHTGIRIAPPSAPPVVPVSAVVFHGDRDATVNPSNGAAVITQCVGNNVADAEGGGGPLRAEVETGSVPGGRNWTRTTFSDPNGRVAAEHWVVHGGGHAWFGGDPSGSFTDPSGPDASAHILRFFAAHAGRD